MTDAPRQRRRRTSKRVTALADGRSPIQQAYQDLASYLTLLSWSVPAVFAEREQECWVRVAAVGEQRGLPTAPPCPPATAAPVDSHYRSGPHQTYRDLSVAVSALVGTAGETITTEERALWQRLWAFGVTRGAVEPIDR
jgi:hypothetical protein